MSKIKDFLFKYLGYFIGAFLLYMTVKNKGKNDQIQKQNNEKLKILEKESAVSNEKARENIKNANEVNANIRKSSDDAIRERLSKYNRD